MHAGQSRQRDLNRAGETLLGRGVLMLLEGLDGPRNRKTLLDRLLLQEECVGSEENEAQRRVHELKHDACSYRPARFEGSYAMWRNIRCRSVSCARTSPPISWHVERTPLNVRACGRLRVSSSSCSQNALSRARESEERATDLSVYMPLWAPQEVARTLSASPLGTSRTGTQVVWARTPRGASRRASGG